MRKKAKKNPVKLCHINPNRASLCVGECRGASTHWLWESCGYGMRIQGRIEAVEDKVEPAVEAKEVPSEED